MPVAFIGWQHCFPQNDPTCRALKEAVRGKGKGKSALLPTCAARCRGIAAISQHGGNRARKPRWERHGGLLLEPGCSNGLLILGVDSCQLFIWLTGRRAMRGKGKGEVSCCPRRGNRTGIQGEKKLAMQAVLGTREMQNSICSKGHFSLLPGTVCHKGGKRPS